MSNAPACKTALFATIKALPGATDWDVSHGFKKSPGATWVYLGKVTWGSTDWATTRSREETFSIAVVINAKRRRKTPAEMESLGMDLLKEIETGLMLDPTLGVASVVTSSLKPLNLDSWPSDETTEVQVEAEVEFTARIRKA